MKAFIIALPGIDESIKTASELHRSLIGYGIDSTIIDGIDGHSAKILINSENRIPHPVMHCGKTITDVHRSRISKPGVIGCFYSHFKLWETCVNLNEPIMIFEDDAVLCRNYIPVEWDGVLLLCMGFEWKLSHCYLKYLTSPDGNPVAIPYTGTCIPGAVGYIIKPDAAKKLCEVYSTSYDAADLAINTNNVPIYYHSYLMGRALVKSDGKKSMTKTAFWDKP